MSPTPDTSRSARVAATLLTTTFLSLVLVACGDGMSPGTLFGRNGGGGAETFSISVTVNGLPGGSVLTLRNNAASTSVTVETPDGPLTLLRPTGDTLAPDEDGEYTFAVALPEASPYHVTVDNAPEGLRCSVENGRGVVVDDVDDVIVTCIPLHAVGGTVTGLGAGGPLTLALVDADNLQATSVVVAGDGAFSFPPQADGSSYAVTVAAQPAWHECTVNAGSGTVTAPVSSIVVTCTPVTARVSTLTVPVPATSESEAYVGTGSLSADNDGNVYLMGQGDSSLTAFRQLRKFAADGTVTTLAGTVYTGNAYQTGAGSGARFMSPRGIHLDRSGNVWLADEGTAATDSTVASRVFRIAADGVVSRVAGISYPVGSPPGYTNLGQGSTDTAYFDSPLDVTVDSQGNAYVLDEKAVLGGGYTYIHKISGTTVSDFAGKPNLDVTFADWKGFVDGAGIAQARFYGARALAVDCQDNLYVADSGNHAVRKITPAGVVSTLAGGGPTSPPADYFYQSETPGLAGYVNASGAAARFNNPLDVAVDAAGHVYVADSGNHVIRRIAPNGEVTTLAGAAASGQADGTATAARFNSPRSVAVGNGKVYVADTLNNRVRIIDLPPAPGVGQAVSADSCAGGSGGGDPGLISVTAPLIIVDATGNAEVQVLVTTLKTPLQALLDSIGAGKDFSPAAETQLTLTKGIIQAYALSEGLSFKQTYASALAEMYATFAEPVPGSDLSAPGNRAIYEDLSRIVGCARSVQQEANVVKAIERWLNSNVLERQQLAAACPAWQPNRPFWSYTPAKFNHESLLYPYTLGIPGSVDRSSTEYSGAMAAAMMLTLMTLQAKLDEGLGLTALEQEFLDYAMNHVRGNLRLAADMAEAGLEANQLAYNDYIRMTVGPLGILFNTGDQDALKKDFAIWARTGLPATTVSETTLQSAFSGLELLHYLAPVATGIAAGLGTAVALSVGGGVTAIFPFATTPIANGVAGVASTLTTGASIGIGLGAAILALGLASALPGVIAEETIRNDIAYLRLQVALDNRALLKSFSDGSDRDERLRRLQTHLITLALPSTPTLL